MFHTIPDMRTKLTKDPTVTFRETPEGIPPAIRSLFYGGEYRGYEFVYPKGGPILLAELAPPQPEVTFAPASGFTVTESTKAEPAPEPGAGTGAPANRESSTLVALGGLASMIVGLGAGFIRKFIS